MAEQRNRWNWEVSGFEPRKSSASVEPEEQKVAAPLVRRYSIASTSALPRENSDLSKQALASKLQRLKDKLKVI